MLVKQVLHHDRCVLHLGLSGPSRRLFFLDERSYG